MLSKPSVQARARLYLAVERLRERLTRDCLLASEVVRQCTLTFGPDDATWQTYCEIRERLIHLRGDLESLENLASNELAFPLADDVEYHQRLDSI